MDNIVGLYMPAAALSRKGNIAPEKAADRPPVALGNSMDERRTAARPGHPAAAAAAAMSHRRR